MVVAHVVHVTVWNRLAIQRLVSAVNSIRGYRTRFGICVGGGGDVGYVGPAWLTFVRANGSAVHAFEAGPGVCGGGLAVNGVHWMTDTGAVWNQITALVQPAAGK